MTPIINTKYILTPLISTYKSYEEKEKQTEE